MNALNAIQNKFSDLGLTVTVISDEELHVAATSTTDVNIILDSMPDSVARCIDYVEPTYDGGVKVVVMP